MPDLNRRAMAKTHALVERENALLADALKVRFFPFAAERGGGVG